MRAHQELPQTSAGETLKLVDVPRALREHLGVSATYWECYKAVIDGRAPAVRNGRGWLVPTAELPRMAEALATRAA